jgi:hypothetical protein
MHKTLLPSVVVVEEALLRSPTYLRHGDLYRVPGFLFISAHRQVDTCLKRSIFANPLRRSEYSSEIERWRPARVLLPPYQKVARRTSLQVGIELISAASRLAY